jgi:hypothetical protein
MPGDSSDESTLDMVWARAPATPAIVREALMQPTASPVASRPAIARL